MAKLKIAFMLFFAFAALAQMVEANRSRRESTFHNLNKDYRNLGKFESL